MYAVAAMLGLMLFTWAAAVWASFREEHVHVQPSSRTQYDEKVFEQAA